MNSSHRLLLLCEIWAVTIGWASSVDFVSHNMKEDLQKLKEHFNTSDKALFRDPVFLRNLQDLESRFEEGEQKVLMGEVLDVYLSILEDMMNRTEDDNLKRSITLTRNRVSDLRKHHFQSKGHLKTQLQDLWAIETDDPLVQRKAVRELTTVFHKASVLGSKKKVPARRRRRQAGRRRI